MFNYTIIIRKGNEVVKTIPFVGSGNDMMNEIQWILPDYPTKDGYMISYLPY